MLETSPFDMLSGADLKNWRLSRWKRPMHERLTSDMAGLRVAHELTDHVAKHLTSNRTAGATHREGPQTGASMVPSVTPRVIDFVTAGFGPEWRNF